MLRVQREAGETLRAAWERHAVRHVGSREPTRLRPLCDDFDRNLAEGMTPEEAALDSLLGNDVSDCAEEVEND